MRLSSLLRVSFILYCIEAGIFLLFAPWSPVWDQTMVQIPLEGLRTLALNPVLRGAVSGFGLIHLVWGAHDLDALLSRRRQRARTDVANAADIETRPAAGDQ
jgi:hypothetical protein